MALPALRRRVQRIVVAGAVAAMTIPASPAAACTSLGTLGRVGNDCQQSQRSPTQSKKRSASSAEAASLRYVNAERERRGLTRLRTDQTALEIARDHSRRMAKKGDIYHNKWLKTPEGRRALLWPSWLGENVGVGQGAKKVHNALMDSRGHRANILFTEYTMVGVGAYVKARNVWITQVFLSRTARRAGVSGDPAAVRAPEVDEERPAAPAPGEPSPLSSGLTVFPGDGPTGSVVAGGLTAAGSPWLPWTLGFGAFGVPAAVHSLVRRRKGTRSYDWYDWP